MNCPYHKIFSAIVCVSLEIKPPRWIKVKNIAYPLTTFFYDTFHKPGLSRYLAQ